MRFAFCNEGFGDKPWQAVCRSIAQAGYDGVEIAPYIFADDVRLIGGRARADIKRAAHDAGLEIVGLHWLLVKPEGMHISHPEESVRKATRDYLRSLTEFCAELGGKVMVFGSPRQRGGTAGATPEQAWQWAKETFGGVLPTLAECGVTLCIEPLAPAPDDPKKHADFINTAAEARKLVEELGHPNFRLLLDVRSMSSESISIPELIKQNADILAHVHANDPNDQAPGYGEVDFRPILQALREVKYSGYVSAEPFQFSEDVEVVAQKALRYLEECLG